MLIRMAKFKYDLAGWFLANIESKLVENAATILNDGFTVIDYDEASACLGIVRDECFKAFPWFLLDHWHWNRLIQLVTNRAIELRGGRFPQEPRIVPYPMKCK